MIAKPTDKPDPLETAIEMALAPGSFIFNRSCYSFVESLEKVESQIVGHVARDPSRAVGIYETFLSGCFEKTEELDDSSGSFGMFVQQLFTGWIKARQASGANADETAARLLAWMDKDPYGFSHALDRDAVPVFNRTGLAAFEKIVRSRFAAASTQEPTDASPNPVYERRRWADSLRAIYLRRKNFAAYRAVAEEAGLTSPDCLALARMLAVRRKLGEALSWADRGLAMDRATPHGSMGGHDLTLFRRELLIQLGRSGEALEDAWAEYANFPCRAYYEDLMRYVLPRERKSWHAKAIAAAESADLRSRIDLLLAVGEIPRLAALVRGNSASELAAITHLSSEPAAKTLEKDHPDAAAILWCAQGMRIVNAKKSEYYEAAHRNFESAKHSFLKAGLPDAWTAVVAEIRTAHHRKSGFIPGFEEIVAGVGPSERPAFLERAKARWKF